MGFFQPLFSISVDHAYFADGLWRGLDFIPDSATMKMVKGAGILIKQARNGIGVFYDKSRVDALLLYRDGSEDGLRFNFRVHARDRKFSTYTSPTVNKPDSILCFDSRNGRRDEHAGKTCLTREEVASEQDFLELDSLIAEGVLDGRNKRVPPDFVASIFVMKGEDNGIAPEDYTIRFNARQSFWKYHLLGNMNRSNPSIVDLDNRVEFEFCGEVVLPDNRPAKVFRSKELLPLMEKSSYRFQLREPGPGNGNGKVLIKRLPVASESRLGMEMINGRNEVVMESFVNY